MIARLRYIFPYLNKKALVYFIRNPLRTAKRLYLFEPVDLKKLVQLTGRELSELAKIYRELQQRTFLYDTVRRTVALSKERSLSLAQLEALYVLIRAIKPLKVLETGVSAGRSTTFIMQALKDNGQGKLYSIDLPPPDIIPGWAVPTHLKSLWELHLGPSSLVMPDLLKELGEIDIFLHDSGHSYDNMMREFQTAWPHISVGGLLLADDVSRNAAFEEFSCQVGLPTVFLNRICSFGAIRKVK